MKLETTTPTETRTYARVSLRLIPFVFLCYVLAYLDRINVGVAKLQMFHDLGFSDARGKAVFSLGAGIFFLGYFFFEVPSNIILKRVGARVWIARIMVTWGLISAATLFTRSSITFYILRFLLGLAEAGFFPGVIFYLTCWYPARRRARMTAWFMTAIALAGIIGNPLSGWIMDHLGGLCHLRGWQWVFLVEGLPSVLVGIWVFFYLDSDIDSARWLNPAEKALLKNNLAADNQGKSHARLADAFTSARVWLLSLVYFCLMIGLYGVSFWLPTIVKELLTRGMTAKAAGDVTYLRTGLLSAIPYGCAAVAMVLNSRHSDATGERRWHTALAALAGGVGLILSDLTGAHPVVSIAFLALATMGILAALPVFWSLPTAFLAGTAAAAGIGLVNSFGNLGGFVGGEIPDWMTRLLGVLHLKDRPGAALYAIAAALFLAAALVLAMVPAEKAKGQGA